MEQKTKRNRKSGFRVFLLFCVACLLFGAMTGCAKDTQSNGTGDEQLPVIVVGIDNYPPYSYTDTDGGPAGIDIELATEAFRRMGYRAEFRYIDWAAKQELVESGAIDCIWSSFSIDGREDRYRWAGPYMYSRQVIAVRMDSDIYSLSDLAGKRIAVQSTTKPEELFFSHSDERLPEFGEIFSLPNRELIYAYLSKGYVDAVAAHETAVLQYMKDYELEYRILEEPLVAVGLGAAFAKSDERGLDTKLSETFEEMRRDGTMERIIGKYLENPGRYLEETRNAK